MNASDDDVLEVFVRINSYAVPVTEPELRNARFDNEFSDLVKDTVKAVPSVWHLGVFSERDRVRMVDQSLIAELFAFLSRGVSDGAESDITKFYTSVRTAKRQELPEQPYLVEVLYRAADYLTGLDREPIVQRPHFLMFCAALMYFDGRLPQGKLEYSQIPNSPAAADHQRVRDSLATLNAALASEESGRYVDFREARASTQRIRSRQIRFEYFCRAIQGEFATF